MILSSHIPGNIPTTDKGGWYLEECAPPYHQFIAAGYEVTICSLLGGDATKNVDPQSLSGQDTDRVKGEFWETKQEMLSNLLPLSSYKGSDFDVFMLVGGFGVMWDFFPNEDVNRVGRECWESNGVVGAVCHGPIGLASIKLSDGEYLVKDKNVAGFTNEEEAALKLTEYYPHHAEGDTVENILTHCGAKHTKTANWGAHVITDGRLVSGQNPASADGVGAAVVAAVAAR
jgi:putative intracellular protease/amidase